MKILIVDDSRINVEMTSVYCSKWGHTVVSAADGIQAIQRYQEESPDLILMDVMMPVMDGFEATARIRALGETRWVPIILLTALDNDDDLVKGIQSGADDYLTKPINFIVLREKIRVMERIAAIQRQLTLSLNRLEDYRDKAEEERRLAAHVMERILSFGQVPDPLITHRVLPALHFSGDLVTYAHTPDGILHVALADATGHGLVAALNVIPITEIFHSMTLKGDSIDNIVTEMNRRIRLLMPRERFVAAILIALNKRHRTLQVWNGGCPTGLFLNEVGKVRRTFPSVHPPLGVLPETLFNDTVDTYSWPRPGQLLLCSDGLLEAENATGIPFGVAGLIRSLLESTSLNRIDRIMSDLRHHLSNTPQMDDISIVTAECP